MKNLIYITVAALLTLTACTKKYCWECTTVEGGGGADTTFATICDQSEDEIKSRIGTYSSVDSSGSKPVYVTYTTTCEKLKEE